MNRIVRRIISRQDVLKALQVSQRQPQVGETIDDIVSNRHQCDEREKQRVKMFIVLTLHHK